ncbi:MAG: type II toxin-antitoxin system HipA family toxin [Lentimicrobiaceae bacterium]|jgi:serine/threonine-protein kinase HipA|nr:type II toxin-antitoxin system HipA family toxin [Lentimicrobiaceae bacterium]
MIRVASVLLWGDFVGAVLWDEASRTASFEYDRAFLSKGLDISPVQMPIATPRIYSFGGLSRDTFMGLPGLLADSLPDAYGKAMLDRWLAFNSRTAANPVERLCYQANRSMGALEFEPAQRIAENDSEQIEIASLVEVARQVLEHKKDLHVDFGYNATQSISTIISVGTSAGGARAKAVIAFNEQTGDVRSGQIAAPDGYNHWLLKLDGVTNSVLGDPKLYGLIEYAYYRMATAAGINMTESRILQEGPRSHFMTRRFDRIGANEKLHTQTLCGLVHFDYRMQRSYSYEQLFEVLRRLKLPSNQQEQMYRRMVFNVVGRNQDDHTKNVSFIMNRRGEWSLSPAYDVSWAYNPAGEWTSRHQMSINNKWDDITRTDLVEFARRCDIDKPTEIIEQVVDAVSLWSQIATELSIPQPQIDAIEKTLRLQI